LMFNSSTQRGSKVHSHHELYINFERREYEGLRRGRAEADITRLPVGFQNVIWIT
jgi:hypothetical protein